MLILSQTYEKILPSLTLRMQLLIIHIHNRFITFPINAQLIFVPIFDHVTGEGLLQVDVSMHHHREEAYTYSKKPLKACHIGFSQHITLLYLMNNLCGSSVSNLIVSMDHHIEMIQKRAEYL